MSEDSYWLPLGPPPSAWLHREGAAASKDAIYPTVKPPQRYSTDRSDPSIHGDKDKEWIQESCIIPLLVYTFRLVLSEKWEKLCVCVCVGPRAEPVWLTRLCPSNTSMRTGSSEWFAQQLPASYQNTSQQHSSWGGWDFAHRISGKMPEHQQRPPVWTVAEHSAPLVAFVFTLSRDPAATVSHHHMTDAAHNVISEGLNTLSGFLKRKMGRRFSLEEDFAFLFSVWFLSGFTSCKRPLEGGKSVLYLVVHVCVCVCAEKERER